MGERIPRITLAGLKGGSGKTILSLGLIASFMDMDRSIAAFKKGPDFIDAGWLGFAAGRPCRNLDAFMLKQDEILSSFLTHSEGTSVSLLEGNRGLFDGMDVEGSCSTAELAKLLASPVILIIDVTMATRTIAALVRGCQVFDPYLDVAGVILNRVAGHRQKALISAAIERYCGVPVVGAVPKLGKELFPERHMGLVPCRESSQAENALDEIKGTVAMHIDLDKVWHIANAAPDLKVIMKTHAKRESCPDAIKSKRLHIGVVRDTAFWFYYPENLEKIENAGAVITEIDALSDEAMPPVDAIYIGGGFPETHAASLAGNRSLRRALKKEILEGLPVYAECGGLMYLGESITVDHKEFPMVGVLPVAFSLEKKPQGHGYTILRAQKPNLYYPLGMTIKGHEFHYSRAVLTGNQSFDFAFHVERGHGIDGRHDGLLKRNVLATYSHVHAAGIAGWGEMLCGAARWHRKGREKKLENMG
jgi:cobyrinic acid a,c-diamide synthase